MNSKSKIPILLIEDNPGDVELIRLFLSDVGFKHEFHHTDSLLEGFESIQTHDIEVVLLDLSLTDSSGFKTLSKFLDKIKYIPVIVLTGQNNDIIGNQSIKAGAEDFLVKGNFDSKQLGRSVRYAMQRFKTKSKLESMARKLAISKNRYLEAQELAQFGNWELDIVSYEMKWSDEIFRIFGFEPGMVEPSFSEYLNRVHPEDREKVEKFFENAGKDSQLHRLEHRILLNGQRYKYLNVQARMFFDEYFEKALLVGALQDITERKLSEQLLFEKQISNQEAKIQEQVLESMSFQIRTPLNSIINLLFLLENTNISPQQSEFVNNLKISIDDLSIVLNNMMNFSLLSGEKLKIKNEEHSAKEFLSGLEKLVSIKAETTSMIFKVDIDEQLPSKIIVDGGKVSLIFYNLIDLLIKNLLPKERLSSKISIRSKSDGDHFLEIYLSDNGRKIDFKNDLTSTLNDPSSSLSAEEQQSLNYNIASKLIEALDGQILFDNKSKSGNKVIITLPVKVKESTNYFTGRKPDQLIRILMAEDHFLNQISTKKVLQSWSDKVTVEIAENGQKAVTAFQNKPFDVILMDLQMPIMNGIEATVAIRKESQIPIIALTANASKQEEEKCYVAGMNDYLTKPFKPEDLYEKIMKSLTTVEAS